VVGYRASAVVGRGWGFLSASPFSSTVPEEDTKKDEKNDSARADNDPSDSSPT